MIDQQTELLVWRTSGDPKETEHGEYVEHEAETQSDLRFSVGADVGEDEGDKDSRYDVAPNILYPLYRTPDISFDVPVRQDVQLPEQIVCIGSCIKYQ